MTFRWSEETTFKFVSEYVEHECLWNIKSPNYKNKQMKQSAYLDLEKTMNIPGFGEKEIKLKIKNIRLVLFFVYFKYFRSIFITIYNKLLLLLIPMFLEVI